MARRYLVLGALAVVAAGALAALLLGLSGGRSASRHKAAAARTGAASPRTLSAASFSASYPASYRLAVRRSALGAIAYELSSTGAAANSVEIPPAGTVALTVDETPTSAFATLHLAGAQPDGAASRQTPLQLMPNFVGTPAGASQLERAARAHAVTLGGLAAAEESFLYSYAHHRNVQVDVLSRSGGEVVNIELDAEPALAAASRTALEELTASWRWR